MSGSPWRSWLSRRSHSAYERVEGVCFVSLSPLGERAGATSIRSLLSVCCSAARAILRSRVRSSSAASVFFCAVWCGRGRRGGGGGGTGEGVKKKTRPSPKQKKTNPPRMGFDPTASRLEGGCTIQLCYRGLEGGGRGGGDDRLIDRPPHPQVQTHKKFPRAPGAPARPRDTSSRPHGETMAACMKFSVATH